MTNLKAPRDVKTHGLGPSRAQRQPPRPQPVPRPEPRQPPPRPQPHGPDIREAPGTHGDDPGPDEDDD